MTTPDYARLMARYNAWQNEAVYGAADTLDAAKRAADLGAFFGSIEATLNHILWADRIWLHRFAGTPKPNVGTIPESVAECETWDDLKPARRDLDRQITDWANGLTDADLAGDLTWYSGALGKDMSKPMAKLVVHFFNHQTHHRGQVHAMLTAQGARTEATDIPFMPERTGG